jgi:hypothetical protein
MNRRRIGFAIAALLLVAVGTRQPTADIQLLTHAAGDLQPHRIQAAINLGVIGVKLIYTWSAGQLR